MNKPLLKLTILLLIAFMPTKINAAYLLPLSTTNVDFGNIYYDLESKTFSQNFITKSIQYKNTRVDNGSGVNPEVQYFGVSNNFASVLVYDGKAYYAGSPFSVAGNNFAFSKERTFKIYEKLGSEDISLVYIRFDVTTENVKHCIDAKDKTCSLSGKKIYYSPYYCLYTATESCFPHDGVVITPSADIIFRLPEVDLSTNSLDFGDVRVGESVTKEITVYNRSDNKALTLTFPDNKGAFSSLSAGLTYNINTGDSKTFEITYTPLQEETVSTSYYFREKSNYLASFIDGESLTLNASSFLENETPTPIEIEESLPEEIVEEETFVEEQNTGVGEAYSPVGAEEIITENSDSDSVIAQVNEEKKNNSDEKVEKDEITSDSKGINSEDSKGIAGLTDKISEIFTVDKVNNTDVNMVSKTTNNCWIYYMILGVVVLITGITITLFKKKSR